LWGVLFPDVQSSFFPSILEGIENVSNEYSYTCFLALSKYDPELMRSHISAMQGRYVEGLLVVPTGQPGEREILMPVLEDIPHVFLCFPLEEEPLASCVRVDDELGGFMGAEHLIKLGHKRIGMLAGTPSLASVKLRRGGFQRALTASGLTMDPELMIPTDFSSKSGYEGMKRLLSLEERPTAIMAVSDLAALGAMEALLEAGLRPGEDVAVVGYDDICCGHHSPVPLTTVRQPKEELGEAAARVLVELLAGKQPRIPLLKPELTVRRSCGAWKRDKVIEFSPSADRLASH
jgi:LacI family transcriptional regulator